jgi:hypothetical protein
MAAKVEAVEVMVGQKARQVELQLVSQEPMGAARGATTQLPVLA